MSKREIDRDFDSCHIVNKYCAYYRVSTARQRHSGLGLAAQQTAVQNYIRTHGGIIEHNFTEIESGKRNARIELQNAITHCKRNKTVLLIAKLDRLSRNLHFITGLMESKIDFVAADNPHANKLMTHMLAAFAEHEREMISERTKHALRAAKARGVKLGTYGQTLAKQNKDKADHFAKTLIPVIDDIRASGKTTTRDICDALNIRGITSQNGYSFYSGTTYRLLKRVDRLQS